MVAEVPTGDAFRARFGNPYAVIHRADVHLSLLEGVRAQAGIELADLDAASSASSRTGDRVTVIDAARARRIAARR